MVTETNTGAPGEQNPERELTVDIVVAVYNGEKYITRCVDSLLATDYGPKRVCIVNDGSTDNTLKELEKYGNKIVIWTKPNGGVSSSRNYAITRSQADLIAITDADCEVDLDWVKNAVGHFKDRKVGAVTGWTRWRITNTISAIRGTDYALRFARREADARSVSCTGAVFKREALLAVDGFDTSYKVGGEDTDIGYKIHEKGYKVVYEPTVNTYHAAEDTLSGYLKKNFRDAKNHLSLMLKREKKASMSDDFFPFVVRFQPVFTWLLVISLLGGYMFRTPQVYLVSVVFLALILYNFIPVIWEVARSRGVSSVPMAFTVLCLRNAAWSWGMVMGLLEAIKKI